MLFILSFDRANWGGLASRELCKALLKSLSDEILNKRKYGLFHHD